LKNKIVQAGIFFLSCAVIDRAMARKNARMGDFNFNSGAPACLFFSKKKAARGQYYLVN
jgi:hypothetical protein